MEVQVAAEGLIVLDIGVLMGSRSPQVFMEMLDRYPGAKRIYDALVATVPCECGDPLCNQNCFQTLITHASGNDRELSAKFIEFVSQADTLTFELLRELQLEFFTAHVAPKQNQSLLERVLGGDFLG